MIQNYYYETHLATKENWLGEQSAYRAEKDDSLAEECGMAPGDRIIYIIRNKPCSENQILAHLREEGVEKLFSTINWLGMTRNMQEYVLEQRPDLIREINQLDPELKEKYKDEWNLSGIEI